MFNNLLLIINNIRRAFGDVRYKWPLELQKAVLGPLGSPPPPNLLTPPYLTAMPEVRVVLWLKHRSAG